VLLPSRILLWAWTDKRPAGVTFLTVTVEYCAASAVLRRHTAKLPMAAENDMAHLRMLQEVKRRVDNAADALGRDLLVATVHSTCQALHLLARPVLC
jgi:hypothetical protein